MTVHIQKYTFRAPSRERFADGNEPLCPAPPSEPYDHAELADCPACFALLSKDALAAPAIFEAGWC